MILFLAFWYGPVGLVVEGTPLLHVGVSKIRVPQNGWFIIENPIKMDDLGVPLFSETSMYQKRTLRPVADHLPRNVHFHAPAARPNVWNEGFSLLGEPGNKPGVPYFPLNPGCLIGIPRNGLLVYCNPTQLGSIIPEKYLKNNPFHCSGGVF